MVARFKVGRLTPDDPLSHAGDTETLPEGTAAALNTNSLRIQEAGSAVLSAADLQLAAPDAAATPPPRV